MGAGQSTASKIPVRALHVLRVTPASPASQTSIEPFFDFVVGFRDDNLASRIDAAELERIVERHEGRPLDLLVWNSKNQNTRVVPIVPSRDWSLPHTPPGPKEPDSDRKPSLLGLSMRMCEPEFALDNVWHVLDVLEGSPAESAGLVPYGDWIIGWSGGALSAEGDFYEVVESHIDKPLRVYVYSYDFDNIREVVLVPNRHWGGEGLLGCVFGFGLLHRIPPVPDDREPGAVPIELTEPLEDVGEEQLFVPADIGDPAETPEQVEERMRWEHEQWDRQSYARAYSQQSSNASPSAYVPRPGSEVSPRATDVARGIPAPRPVGHSHRTPPVRSSSPLATSYAAQRELARSSRSSPVNGTPHPSSTPRPTSPFGYHVNGLGIRARTPSWDARGSLFEVLNRDSPPRPGSAPQADEDHDGAKSVAGTEATDASEMTSHESLTSVD